ncbi:MAG: alpha/beta superfamily hydrolase, partial [Planctomycetota bacterium]
MKISFPGPAGALEGVLWAPTDGPPTAAAVMCHPHPSHGGSMDSSVVFRAARGLHEAGLAVLRFNFRGVGASEGEHHGQGGPGSEEDDLGAALDYLQREYGRGIPLWAGGFSFGSRPTIGLAVRDARIQRVVLVALPILAYECSVAAELTTPGLAVMADKDTFGTATALRERFPELAQVLRIEEVAE